MVNPFPIEIIEESALALRRIKVFRGETLPAAGRQF